jgi:hypothetical protein
MPTEVLRSDTFEQWRVKTNTIGSDLGTKADLSANITANGSLVTAINELQSDIGVIGSLSANITANTNLVGAVNELQSDIGVVGDLTTTSKVLVNAVNELKDSAITFNGVKTFGDDINLATSKVLKVNNTTVLSATALGSGVVGSSLTSVGTIGTGIWQGTIISPTYGGTGVNNGSRTLTVATGNISLTAAAGGSAVTLPATGTLATIAGTETLTGKTIELGSNTVSGTLAQFNDALTDANFATLAGIETLTGKTIALGLNTVSGTLAQFNDALTDANITFATVESEQTLTTKTINLASNTIRGTLAQFNDALTDADFATLAGTQTLTGKTIALGSNTVSGTLAQFNTALTDADFATLAGTETLTNKTFVDASTEFVDDAANTKKFKFQVSTVTANQTRVLSIPDNDGTIITSGDTGTVTNTMLAGSIAEGKLAGAIPNTKLVHSKVTIGTTDISLGSSSTTLAGLTSVTSTNFVGNLTGTVTGGITGNAATATKLATAVNINGTAFDGSANITVTAAAGTLTGATLAAGVTASSLTSVGTLSGLTVSGTSTLGVTTIAGPDVETDVLKVRNTSTDKFTVDTLGNVFISGNLQVSGTTTIAASNLSLDWADIVNKPDPKVTVNMTGPVTGSGNATLEDLADGTIAIATSLANDSIALGTKTTGDYVAGVTGDTDIVVTNGTGEGVTAALSAGTTLARRADTTYVGTTAIPLNRASANQALGGILSIALPGSSSGTITLTPVAVAGSTAITIPATTGTLVTTGDTGTVTNAMLAGSIANAKLANNTISGVALGSNLAALTLGDGLDGTSSGSPTTSYNGSAAVTASVSSSVARRADTVYIGTTAVALNRTSASQALTGITSVTLPGSTSGTVQIIPEAVAGTNTVLTIPARTGTIITSADTGTVTNTMLAGSIANAKLTNSGVTVSAGTGLSGGGSVSLGGSVTLSHATVTSAATSVDNSGGTVIQDLTFDTFGHVTGTASVNLDSRYLQAEADTLATVTGRGATTTATITAGGFTTTGAVSTGTITTTGNATVGGSLSVTGDLTVSGSVTTINTEEIKLADNVIVLNSNYAGATPTENAGISVNRGTAGAKSFEWNETSDKWTLGGETLIAGTFEGALSGNAATASSAARLTTARNINGVPFDGTENITIPITLSNALSAGSGLRFTNEGETYNGSDARTLLVDTNVVATVIGSQSLTGKTYNGLSLTAATTGFTVAGGTTSKTLTVKNTLTLEGTDSSTLNIGAGGTLGSAAFTGSGSYATAAQGTKIDGASNINGLVKANGAGTFSAAVAGTDYATATQGARADGAATVNGVIKSDGAGVFSAAVPGTDFASATQGAKADALGNVNGLIKSNGASTFEAAVAGADYVVPSGSITGNAATATKLAAARNINGTPFDGSANITVTANTTNALAVGTGLSLSAGTSFNGSAALTITNSGVTSITGTTNQVVASAASGAVTLSLPQSINTAATVQFGVIGVNVANAGTTYKLDVSGDTRLNGDAYITPDNAFYISTGATGGLWFSGDTGATNAGSMLVTPSNLSISPTGSRGIVLNAGNAAPAVSIAHTSGNLTAGANVRVTTALNVGSGTALDTFGADGEIRAKDNITAYYSSDERLKTNITKIDGALEKISQIDGVIYDWNETYLKDHGNVDGYFVRERNSGVIAQQVEKVFPNVVADRADGYKAVRYELLVPLLIEAIKELKEQIAELKK